MQIYSGIIPFHSSISQRYINWFKWY